MKVEEILQEIESMAMLDHPNVIKALAIMFFFNSRRSSF